MIIRDCRLDVVVLCALLETFPAAAAPAEPAATGPSSVSGPRIEFVETTHDFGLRPPQKAVKLEHDFKFRNAGNQDLVIRNVGNACRTVGRSPEQVVPPGSESVIRVTSVIPAEYTDAESFSRAIKVETNDPAQPVIELKTEATFRYTLKWSPERVDFGSLAPGSSAKRTVEIESVTTAPCRLLKAECASPVFGASVEPTTGTAGKYRVTVQADPSAAVPGDVSAVLKLHTDATDIPVIEIPLCASLVSEVRIKPESLFLGIIRTAKPVEHDISLVSTRPGLKITGVTSSLPGVASRIVPADDGYRIRLTYDPSQASGAVEGDVVVRTNSATAPEFRIPVQGLVKLARKP